jgi:hypothetical protein
MTLTSTDEKPRNRPKAIYNSRVPNNYNPSPTVRLACRLLLVFCLLCGSSTRLWSLGWEVPEQQLAHKIAAATGPGVVSLEVVNRSSISRNDSEEITRALQIHLSAAGVQSVKAEQAAASVQVSLSENLQNYVWVAEIHQGTSESSVVMISFPHPAGATFSTESSALTVRKTLLWSQDQRILDVVSLDVNGNPLNLIVLTPDQLGLYRFQDGHWQQDQSLPITHARSWPRDLRGRLVLSKAHLFDIYLPGTFCQSTAVAPLSIACHESNDPWPVGNEQFTLSAFFVPRRNFFTGALVPGVGKQTTAPSFYSAAALPREKYALWLFAATSGQIHALDGTADQTIVKSGWGSDIASIKTNCGSGWQVLASGSGDAAPDTIRVFEFPDREPVPVAQPLELNGNITALWTEPSGSTAIVISQNSGTGRYEVYRLAIACGR